MFIIIAKEICVHMKVNMKEMWKEAGEEMA